MNLHNRYHSQILKLIELKLNLGQNDGPLDKKLQRYFRKNKQFGSKDRKWCSAVLFGYWRWHGWLRYLESDELQLFLGYLFDSNEIGPLARDWANKLGLGLDFLKNFEHSDRFDLEKKLRLLQSFLPQLQLDDLNPEFIPAWPLSLHDAMQKRADLWLRRQGMGRAKLVEALTPLEVEYEFHEKLPSAVRLCKPVVLDDFPPYQKGLVEVQDLHSQLVGTLAAPQSGQKWLDLCAGAGGKSLHLASIMRPKGRILGLEIRPKMVEEARKRAKRGFFPNLEFRHWNGVELPQIGPFDGVLVDAPCTGSGTWRRAPDLRWRTQANSAEIMAKTQKDLLQKGASQTQKGGLLVYSTCSIFTKENQEVIEHFLRHNPDFSLQPFFHPFTGEMTQGMHLFIPPDGDGIFISTLRRQA